MGDSVDPSALSRLSQALRPDWSRTVMARRVAAAGLVVLAGVAALRSNPDGDRADIVVASRDLQPGITLTADDVHAEKQLAATVPEGAQSAVDAVVGSTLAGPARRGEILTDVRLLGPRLAESTAGPNARIVPLHLADAALLDMLRTGDVVDVLAVAGTVAGGEEPRPHVVATGAVVVLISPKPAQRGSGDERVVLVALPAATAHTVAGVALVETVTLTFH